MQQQQKKKKKSKSKKMTEEEENGSSIQTTSNSMDTPGQQQLSSQQRNNLTAKTKIRKPASVSRSNLRPRPKMKFNGNTQSPQFGLTPPPPLPHPNFHSQLMPSPRQNTGLIPEESHFHSGDTTAQPLQAVAMRGSYSLAPQIRVTGVQQHMNKGQNRSDQTQLTSIQAQSLPRPASMNPQLSGLAQNGQSTLIQNTLSQQWLKEMPVMSTPNTPSYRLQQQRQQQALLQASSSNAQNTSMALNNQQLSQIVQQQQWNPQPMGHPQLIQLQQQYLQLQSQQQQHPLQPQLPSTPQQQLLHHPQQQHSPRVVAPANQKSPCQTGSQPDATGSNTAMPGGSLSPGTEASNHLGKRRIQDLVSQVDPEGKLDPEVEDLLLEIADNFIDSVTSFACSLAKHRRSSTVESKDVLLHLEKNFGLTIPGFSSEGEKRRKNDVCTLMESSNSDAGSAKEMTRQGGGYSIGVNNHLMRLSTTSEHLISQTFSS